MFSQYYKRSGTSNNFKYSSVMRSYLHESNIMAISKLLHCRVIPRNYTTVLQTSNSEENSSEFLEDFGELFPWYYLSHDM